MEEAELRAQEHDRTLDRGARLRLVPDEVEAQETGIIGTSWPIRRLRQDIKRYAPLEATVVIRGESGTGKELVARALHSSSPRAGHPFVAANAAALPKSLLASELFGHERGAFTGAMNRRKGLFEQANGGTLFLDEIGELQPDIQVWLLRVLENGEVRPIGAEHARKVQVRLVVATHRNLETMVRLGELRPDLYYRLSVLPIEVPPLRHRLEDIPELVARILSKRLLAQCGHKTLGKGALEELGRYHWPGNVRQLENVLMRAAAQARSAQLDTDTILWALALERRIEPCLREDVLTMQAALEESGGNVTEAAGRLGIARTTFRDRIRSLGIGR